jgi:Na+:H+ antiporter
MNETHFAVEIFIILLLVASGVAMIGKWVRVPYTLMLVIVGLIISPMHFLPAVHISPELILLIFLPALLFEASWNLKLQHLRENLLPILTLATLGVGLSVGVIGVILNKGLNLPWSSALLFGSMISATDPVSVLALFKKLGLPKRLTTIVEGESLLNDGTAAVVFNIILGVAVGTSVDSVSGLALHSLREFGLVVFGGLAVGALIGLVASVLTSYFDDHLLEITLTTIAAYGSFLFAEGVKVSPVIAVLVTGLIIGNYGRQIGMSSTTQVAVNSFWEYAGFVVNSLVFLLIGLEIQVSSLLESMKAIGWAVLALLVARAAAIYGLTLITNRFTQPISFKWQHVLFWGGLRGSLSIALVLSLPSSLPGRPHLVVMIFGAVIFSLLVQGLTISPLLRRLRFSETSPGLREYELLQSQLLAETAALAEIDELRSQGRITERLYGRLRTELAEAQQSLTQDLSQLDASGIDLEQEQFRRMRQHLIGVKKARLTELLQDGMLSEGTYQELTLQLDQGLAAVQSESKT